MITNRWGRGPNEYRGTEYAFQPLFFCINMRIVKAFSCDLKNILGTVIAIKICKRFQGSAIL
jgi:hypothetical protein